MYFGHWALSKYTSRGFLTSSEYSCNIPVRCALFQHVHRSGTASFPCYISASPSRGAAHSKKTYKNPPICLLLYQITTARTMGAALKAAPIVLSYPKCVNPRKTVVASGFFISLPSFAKILFQDTPTEAVIPSSSRTRRRISFAISSPEPNKPVLPVTSSQASSSPNGSI